MHSFPIMDNLHAFSDSLGEVLKQLTADPRPLIDPLQERLLHGKNNEFQTQENIFGEIDRQQIPMFRDIYFPAGLGYSISNRIDTPWDAQPLMFCFMRDQDKGPIPGEAAFPSGGEGSPGMAGTGASAMAVMPVFGAISGMTGVSAACGFDPPLPGATAAGA